MTKTTKRRVGGASRGKAARRSAAEWATEVAAWKQSGETSGAYARGHGISAATLLWWSCRGSGPTVHSSVEAKTGAAVRRSRGAGARAAGQRFLPVEVVTAAAETPRVEVEVVLAGGRRVRVAGELTLDEFARLLEVVEGGGAC